MGRIIKKEKLVILGASSFAVEIADLVSESDKYELVGFIEGIDQNKCNQKLSGLPIIWIDDVVKLDKSYQAVCAVGSVKRQKFIQQAQKFGLNFTTVVHSLARISRTASIGEGTIVNAGVIVAAKTRIGRHVIINRGCLIGHHVDIGDYVTVSPGVNIAGGVRIANSSYVGIGAIVLEGISIGANSVVGAGAVVTRDVPERVQVVGVPARVNKNLD